MPRHESDDIQHGDEQVFTNPQQPQDMRQVWSPDNTIVIGANEYAIDNIIDDLPFLQDYATITGPITISDIAGRHIVGEIPDDLDHHALTVTRYSVRPARKHPSEWTIEDYLNPQPDLRELVTHHAEQIALNQRQVNPEDHTFITTDVQQALHWRRTGLFDYTEHTLVITTDDTVAESWSEQGSFDSTTTIMLIEPERWLKDVPTNAAVLYTAIPDHTEEMLIHNKHVAGPVPPHLKHLARSITAWPHDPNTGTFGQPVTVRNHLIARTALSP